VPDTFVGLGKANPSEATTPNRGVPPTGFEPVLPP
jgi:hypothetical protein